MNDYDEFRLYIEWLYDVYLPTDPDEVNEIIYFVQQMIYPPYLDNFREFLRNYGLKMTEAEFANSSKMMGRFIRKSRLN